MKSSTRLNSRSISQTIPLEDGIYYGSWLACSVCIPFEDYEVRFVTKKGIGIQERKAEVALISGVAYVVEKR